jgi:hypothetical protein
VAPGPFLQIIDKNRQGSPVVSDGLVHETVVGLGMNLGTKLTNGVAAPVSSWTYADNARVMGQTIGITGAATTATLPPATPSATAVYYWDAQSGNYFPGSVWVQAVVGDQLLQSIALYDVEAPSVTTQMTAYLNSPGLANLNCENLGTMQWFVLGSCETPLSQGSAGITSSYGIESGPDFGGWYTESQVINTVPSPTPAGGAPYPSTAPGQYWADGCWYVDTNSGGNNIAPGYDAPNVSASYGPAYDAPGYALSGAPFSGLTVNETFQDYAMFEPAVQKWDNTLLPSIWVAFAQIFWGWGGNVTRPNLAQPFVIGSPSPWVTPGTGYTYGPESTWLLSWNNTFEPVVNSTPNAQCINPSPSATTTPPGLPVYAAKVRGLRPKGNPPTHHNRKRRHKRGAVLSL